MESGDACESRPSPVGFGAFAQLWAPSVGEISGSLCMGALVPRSDHSWVVLCCIVAVQTPDHPRLGSAWEGEWTPIPRHRLTANPRRIRDDVGCVWGVRGSTMSRARGFR